MANIAVLDAGGQYCHLIAKAIRGLGVHAEIHPLNASTDQLAKYRGVILSGGPRSVMEPDAPRVDGRLLSSGKPVLGICYGHQLIAHDLGGSIRRGTNEEYGFAKLRVLGHDSILKDIDSDSVVWMSHGDVVIDPPPTFRLLGTTSDTPVAVMANPVRQIFSVQFHPEVSQTEVGVQLLRNFVFDICKCPMDWDPKSQVPTLVREIQERVGNRRVFFLISGGVDSTVAFSLCVRALGPERVAGVVIDTGFMRKGEIQSVTSLFASIDNTQIRVVRAEKDFLRRVTGLVDAESKRHAIGEMFLEVAERVVAELEIERDGWVLGQGTIYPDTIESGGTAGASVIKTHHNRIPVFEQLISSGRVVEPLREFYKHEVRELAKQLDLPADFATKHPFPGPGLAIRCLCSKDSGPVVRRQDVESIASTFGLRSAIVPVRTVGVKGDLRTYENLAVVQGTVPWNRLNEIATLIVNRCKGVNRVAVMAAREDVDATRFHVQAAKITRERVDLLREVDSHVIQTLRESGLYGEYWQFPVVLVPFGLDGRESIALRPVCSRDGMTAEFGVIPRSEFDALVASVFKMFPLDAVLYDITNKPPATVEWE